MPVPRGAIVVGMVLAASLWLAAFLVSVPHVWVLGRGVSIVRPAVTLGFIVGTLLSVALAAFGLLVSGISSSNKFSLAACFFVVLAMFAPTSCRRWRRVRSVTHSSASTPSAPGLTT